MQGDLSEVGGRIAPARALPWRGLASRIVAVGASPHAGWLAPGALLLAWQAASSAGMISDAVLPSPAAVAAAGWSLTLSGELPHHMGVSFLRAMAGLAVGGGIGFALGLANGSSALSHRATDTALQMARNVPHLALIPLVILWFGIGEEAKLFLVALGVFFPVYVNTLHGIRSVDPQLVEMGRCYGMTRAALFRRVVLPGALPSVFVGLRFALGVMWLTLIVAETIAAQSGIGYMAMQARDFLQTDVIVLAILIYAVLGKLADGVTRALERRCLAWNPAYRA
ncbi:ABC transporter permease subunit [Lichenibacterium minor]|uniref:ABC transporter permease subunit n=1 Tax=Lichenibacterium minor TaxID=2316528 RepID=A0A4Q2U8P0_9HYPH|nr:ABC transporter permease subunit [Lichenibacterium minor]RYC31255.1 ABC transporter permease subunit [Lichenibacterium minor]